MIYKHHGIVWEFKTIWKYLKYAVRRKHSDFGAETRFTTVSVINIQKQAAIPPQSADPDILS